MPHGKRDRAAALTRLSSSALLSTVRTVCRAMREPLNVLQLQLHLLEHGLEEREGMREQVRRLDDLVSVFFEFSQPCRIRLEFVDPVTLLDQLADTLGVHVERPGTLPKLAVDRVYLIRALQHAVVRLERLGAVSVRVQASTASSPNRVIFELQGAGGEVDESLAPPPSEAVLRTTIVERIVRAHGGALEVSSAKSGAGRMRFTFPLAAGPRGRHARENHRAPRR